jgi:hypothetical protein
MVLLQNHLLSPAMPTLRNARHEKFAAGIARGLNGADAYLAAGYALARYPVSQKRLANQGERTIKLEIQPPSAESTNG